MGIRDDGSEIHTHDLEPKEDEELSHSWIGRVLGGLTTYADIEACFYVAGVWQVWKNVRSAVGGSSEIRPVIGGPAENRQLIPNPAMTIDTMQQATARRPREKIIKFLKKSKS